MLRNITIKTRLYVLIFLVIVSGTFLTVWQTLQLSNIKTSFELYKEAVVQGEVNILQISRDMNYCSRLMRSIMLGDNFEKNYNKLTQRINDIKQHFSHLKSSSNLLKTAEKNQLLSVISDSEKDTMAFLNDGLRRMDDLSKTERSQQIRNEAWADYHATASPLANKARSSFKKLIKIENKFKIDITKSTEKNISQTRFFSSIFMFVSLIVTVFFTLILTRSISKPLQYLKENIVYIEKNSDIHKRILLEAHDELSEVAQAFDRMLEKFQSILLQVRQAIVQLSDSSSSLITTTESASENIGQQQSAVSHITDVMNILDNTVYSIVNNTERANKAVNRTTSEANAALNAVEQTKETINKLDTDAASASEMIHALEQDTDAIGGVMDVIKSIAEQTNLLALNAAIEAARAGEQGRGFAVVADEVRTLASRTQESTAEIQTMVERLQSGSSSAVQVMEANRTQTLEVVKSAEKTYKAINSINSSINEITQVNAEINDITQQQSESARDMKQTISSINQLTNITSQHSDKNKEASQELEQLAMELNDLISQFKVS